MGPGSDLWDETLGSRISRLKTFKFLLASKHISYIHLHVLYGELLHGKLPIALGKLIQHKRPRAQRQTQLDVGRYCDFFENPKKIFVGPVPDTRFEFVKAIYEDA